MFTNFRPRSVLTSRPPISEAGKHLDDYLSELSQMPEVDTQPNSKVATPTKTPIFNPPTPFANTPSFATFDSRRLLFDSRNEEKEASKKPVVQSMFRADDSDSNDSTEMAPRSLRSPMPSPTFPSLIQDSVSTQTVSIKQQEQALAQLNNPDLSQNVLTVDNLNTQRNFQKTSQKFQDSESLPEKSEDMFHSKIPLLKFPNPSKNSDPASLNPFRFDPPTFRSNVDNDPSLASSLQESVSIKIPEESKADSTHQLEAAIRFALKV